MILTDPWGTVAEAASKAWSALGPLVGLCIGAYLAKRWQRNQWIADSKRAEYRKLLTTTADAGSRILIHYGLRRTVVSGKQEFMIEETVRRSVDVIYNRLFIAQEVRELNVLKRWEEGISALRRTHDVGAFGKCMDAIMEDIRKIALRDLA